jgi:2-polyprenyl-3-methyl-5-hydroxy-6-metoxy-1,4-benzoquinol methylase
MFINILRRYRPEFISLEIQKLIFPRCQTLLDVGCGENSVVRLFSKKLKKSVGIDIFKNSLLRAKKKGVHSSYKTMNALDIDEYFKKQSFDCVIAIDLVEHLKKADSLSLIKKMEKVAKRIVIIKTTNGYVKQGAIEKNPYQKHLSCFSSKDFIRLNYKIMGIDGPKFLRVGRENKPYKFNLFISILSTLLDPIFRNFPNKSFNILAYKYVSV